MWNIIFYEKENGDLPVKQFLESLSEKHYAKALREIDLLEEYGTTLKLPYAKHVQGKLWELRVVFANDISRVFYFVAVDKDIVLLHGFVKKTPKTPNREIKIANTYLRDYVRRNNL